MVDILVGNIFHTLSHTIWLEDIAIRLEAIAIRLEAIWLEAIWKH